MEIDEIERRLFERLPEYRWIVHHIPIAKVVVQNTSTQLRFLQYAYETKMSIRDVCDAYSIPWHARKVPENKVHYNVLDAAIVVSPSAFCRGIRNTADWSDASLWAGRICRLSNEDVDGSIIDWIAIHTDGSESDADFRTVESRIRRYQAIPKGATFESVLAAEKRMNARLMRRWHGGAVQGPPPDMSQPSVEAQLNAIDMAMISNNMSLGRYTINWVDASMQSDDNQQNDGLSDEIEFPTWAVERISVYGLNFIRLSAREDFDAAGEMLGNCIASYRDGSHMDYFSGAKNFGKYTYIAFDGPIPIGAVSLSNRNGGQHVYVVESEITTSDGARFLLACEALEIEFSKALKEHPGQLPLPASEGEIGDSPSLVSSDDENVQFPYQRWIEGFASCVMQRRLRR